MSNYPDDFAASAHDARYGEEQGCGAVYWQEKSEAKRLIAKARAADQNGEADDCITFMDNADQLREEAIDACACACGRCGWGDTYHVACAEAIVFEGVTT